MTVYMECDRECYDCRNRECPYLPLIMEAELIMEEIKSNSSKTEAVK
jgi:hypothetical protein